MAGEDVIEVTGLEWEKTVERSELPVAVMFYTPSCPHCRAIAPYFEAYAREFRGRMVFARLNLAMDAWIGERYGIRGTPTFKFFCHGRPVQEIVGAVYPALIKRAADEVLKYGKECVMSSTAIDYEITGYG